MSIPSRTKRSSLEGDARLANDAETAEYIADLLKQLEKMAQTGGLVRLQYLLRECVEEAEKRAAA